VSVFWSIIILAVYTANIITWEVIDIVQLGVVITLDVLKFGVSDSVGPIGY
jgi:hypothetical protein